MSLAEKLKLTTFVPLSARHLEMVWDDAQEVVEEGVELSPDCAMSVASLVPALVQEVHLVREFRGDLVQAAEKIASLQRQVQKLEQMLVTRALWSAPTLVIEFPKGMRMDERGMLVAVEEPAEPRPPEANVVPL